jgi:hypothetical protein
LQLLKPLTTAIKEGKETLDWMLILEITFQHSKQVLTTPVRHWRPPATAGTKFSAELKCLTFYQELLSFVTFIKHFRHMLEEWDFQLWTNHRLLVTGLTYVSEPWSG